MCRAADMLKTIYPVHLYCAMNRHIKSVRAVDIVRAAAHSPLSSLRGNVCIYIGCAMSLWIFTREFNACITQKSSTHSETLKRVFKIGVFFWLPCPMHLLIDIYSYTIYSIKSTFFIIHSAQKLQLSLKTWFE